MLSKSSLRYCIPEVHDETHWRTILENHPNAGAVKTECTGVSADGTFGCPSDGGQ